MGTHPIFESDFDCLTEMLRTLYRPSSLTIKLNKNIGKIGRAGYKSFAANSKESGGHYKRSVGERRNDAYFKDRIKTIEKGQLMPKAYYDRNATRRRQQSLWDRTTAEERLAIDEWNLKRPKIESKTDFLETRGSNIYASDTTFNVPNVATTPLIKCGGVGDKEKYGQRLNEEYHRFHEIPVFVNKFGKTSPSKTLSKEGRQRRHLKRPELNIISCQGNPSAHYGAMVNAIEIDPMIQGMLRDNLNIRQLSTIQTKVLENFYKHEGDLICAAETGSGKTYAYLLPLLYDYIKHGHESLIITKSVALANQIREMARNLIIDQCANVDESEGAQKLFISVFGPFNINRRSQTAPISVQALNSCHTTDANHRFKTVVFDEADLLTNFNHYDHFRMIRESMLPGSRTMLFSACSSRNFEQLKKRLNNPLSIETDFANRIPLHIQQTFRRVKTIEREAEIVELVRKRTSGATIVFANRSTETFHISRVLNMYGIPHVRLGKETCHDVRDMSEAIAAFNSGDIRIIVSSDILSRGLNLPTLKRVINYSPPRSIATYLNRVGRLGRINSRGVGHAVTFATNPEAVDMLRVIELSVRKKQKLYSVNEAIDINPDFGSIAERENKIL